MKCLIIDDERPAQLLLENYVKKVADLQLVACVSSAIDANTVLQADHIDLLFLDIQMPDLTGVEFIKMLKNKPLTILTTAYSEYALQGYELDVVDYLLKPISFERFFKSVNKVIEIWKNQQSALSSSKKMTAGEQENENYIFIKSGYDILKVNFDAILYIEGMREYTCIYTDSQKIMSLISLQKFTEILPAYLFARVHRSNIVNISKISHIQGNTIKIGKAQVLMSKSMREDFFKLIDKYKLL
jgi:DNA-binding LytR/AlgR family response regulator